MKKTTLARLNVLKERASEFKSATPTENYWKQESKVLKKRKTIIERESNLISMSNHKFHRIFSL